MALINCPECNKQVSDKAKSCPNCGFPISEYISKLNNSNPDNMSMEFNMNVDDSNITTINGIKIDLGNLISTNSYDISTSIKALNSITNIGIVQAKNIIDDFIKNNPEYDKETEFNDFIKEQAILTQKFKTDKKIGKLWIDYEAKLFRLGFWSYIYKFEDISDIIINNDSSKTYVEIHMNHEHIPNIKINIPNFKNIKNITKLNSLKEFSIKNSFVTKEEAFAKASEIRDLLISIKNL